MLILRQKGYLSYSSVAAVSFLLLFLDISPNQLVVKCLVLVYSCGACSPISNSCYQMPKQNQRLNIHTCHRISSKLLYISIEAITYQGKGRVSSDNTDDNKELQHDGHEWPGTAAYIQTILKKHHKCSEGHSNKSHR